MAAKSFKEPVSYDHEIMDGDKKMGEVRIKPSTIMWKPKSAQKYKAVSIEMFEKFMLEHGEDKDK